MTFKEKIVACCHEMIESKMRVLREELDQLLESLAGESKSSAGDKHETSRAHLHIEQERLSSQLNDLTNQKITLDKLPMESKTNGVAAGSLVETSRGWFYIGIALGKLKIDRVEVISISLQSPLGMSMKEKKRGDQVEFKGLVYNIINLS